MAYQFNPFTGNFDLTAGPPAIPDPLTLNNLTVNTLLTAAHIHGNVAGGLYIHVKNTSGGTLAKGTPVYVTGAVGDTTTLEVAAADSVNAAKTPAIGLLDSELTQNASGHATMFGEMTGINTGSYQIGDELYLAAGGGLTATKPTSGYVQCLAVVGRVHASTGTLLVWTAGEVPPTDLTYTASTRLLSSSTGADVTLPEATTTVPGLMAAADKSKLDGIAAGAEVNVNADWNASSGDAQILNKPTIPGLSDATPQAPGTAAAGTSSSASRADHVHELPAVVSSSTAGLAPATSYAAITYAADVELDLATLDGQVRTISLTGNLSLTTLNRAAGRRVVLRLICDSTQRTLTFPSGWTFVGTKPANIAASKTAVLSLTFFGTASTDGVAAYAVQS